MAAVRRISNLLSGVRILCRATNPCRQLSCRAQTQVRGCRLQPCQAARSRPRLSVITNTAVEDLTLQQTTEVGAGAHCSYPTGNHTVPGYSKPLGRHTVTHGLPEVEVIPHGHCSGCLEIDRMRCRSDCFVNDLPSLQHNRSIHAQCRRSGNTEFFSQAFCQKSVESATVGGGLLL